MISYSAIATSEVSYSTTEGFVGRYLIAEGSKDKHSILVAYEVGFSAIEEFEDTLLIAEALRPSLLLYSGHLR